MKKRKVSIFMFATDRVLRLTPSLLIFILFTQSLPLLNFAGPGMMRVQQQNADVCFNNGWKDLLFVNNFDVVKDLCIPMGWLMAADFQICILMFPLLLLISKSGKTTAYTLLICTVIVSIAASGLRYYSAPFIPLFPNTAGNIYYGVTYFFPEYYNTIYFVPGFAVGMMLGLWVMDLEEKKRNGNQTQTPWSFIIPIHICTWITVLTCVLAYWNGTFAFGDAAEITYNASIRTVFSFIYAFCFYELFNCEWKLLKMITRNRVVVVCSRLSLAWFLTHPISIMYLVGASDVIQTNGFILIGEGNFVAFTSFMAACLLYVFVEAPVGRLLSFRMKKYLQPETSIKSE
jgi:hypothetical protein